MNDQGFEKFGGFDGFDGLTQISMTEPTIRQTVKHLGQNTQKLASLRPIHGLTFSSNQRQTFVKHCPGARVYHNGGCPDCPEFQEMRLAYLVGRMGRAFSRPENLICPVCRRSLLPSTGRWTYFVQARSGEIKIGSATGLMNRIGTLQIGHPHWFQILALDFGTSAIELNLHEQFADHRERGEWFYPSDEIIEYAKTRIWVDLPFHEVRDAITESQSSD